MYCSNKKSYRFLTAILLIVFLLSGCAMKAQKVNLAAPTAPQVMVCYDALQKTIGIAPVNDERPPVEKTGDKPHGIYLLLWNQRIGNYISGDKDFNDSVNTILPDQIGRAISRTNCFFQSKILQAKVPPQPTPEDLLVLLGREKIHYLLQTQVKHLYGQQRQRAYFYAIPAFFVDFFGWGNEIGPSEGHTELIFTLYDTQMGHELLREKVITNADSMLSGSYPQAARDSFLEASQQMANHIYRFVQLQQGSTVFNPEKT